MRRSRVCDHYLKRGEPVQLRSALIHREADAGCREGFLTPSETGLDQHNDRRMTALGTLRGCAAMAPPRQFCCRM